MLIRPLKLTGYQGLWGVVFKLFEVRLWGQFIFISQIKFHKNFMPTALVESTSALGLAIAEILGDPYVKMVPLPRIPNYRDLGRRPNPLSVRNSNIAERTQVRKNLNLLNGQAELMTSQ